MSKRFANPGSTGIAITERAHRQNTLMPAGAGDPERRRVTKMFQPLALNPQCGIRFNSNGRMRCTLPLSLAPPPRKRHLCFPL